MTWQSIPGASSSAWAERPVMRASTVPAGVATETSVPGPPIPLTFAGAPITGIHPFGPVYDGMLLNITAIGREKSVDIGLVACRDGVPELWSLVEGMEEALRELQEAAAAPSTARSR